MITKLNQYKESILVPRNLEGRQEKAKQLKIKIFNDLKNQLKNEIIEGDLYLQNDPGDNDIIDYNLLDNNEINVKTINGDLHIFFTNFTRLPKWLKNVTIKGDFICIHNKLITLENLPIIEKSIDLSYNVLKSIEGLPETVNGDLSLVGNILSSLKGCSKIVNGNFECDYNILTSLEYCPKYIKGDFECYNNKAEFNLSDIPDVFIKGKFYNT